MSTFEKKISYKANGKDQLGNMIGQIQPGDKVKLHVDGYFMGQPKPLFSLFAKRKQVGAPSKPLKKMNFLNTHIAGDTAFIEVVIPKAIQAKPTLPAVLMDAVRTMILGEAATITFTTGVEGITERIHKAHHEDVPPNTTVILEVDLFRVVRDGKEHMRVKRNLQW